MDDTTLSILLVPLQIIVAVLLLAGLGVLVLRFLSRRRRERRRKERRIRRTEVAEAETPEEPDADPDPPEIKAYPMPVIGLIEERVYDELEDLASQSILGHRVLTQLSMSAFLYAGSSGLSRAEERKITSRLGALQVDFLVVDGDWRPVVAINIERDSVSASDALETESEICARAGVAYLIVPAGGLSDEHQKEIRKLLQDPQGIAAE